MNLRKLTALCVAMTLCVPLVVLAQSSDDVILNLLSALETPTYVPAPAKSTSTPTSAAAQPAAKPAAPKAPAEVILPPLYLFNIEPNAPKQDPEVANLKSMLAALVQQFAVLSSKTPQTSTSASTTASSTTPSAPVIKKQYLRNLDVGSKGADVKALQEAMIRQGYLFGEATGYYGILTKTAVASFQEHEGLPSVGSFGPRTRAVLEAYYQAYQAKLAQSSGGKSDPIIQLPLGPAAVPLIASSTSISIGTSTAASTSPQGSDTWGKPVSVSMTILPSEVPVGGSVSVTWLSQNADTCEASDGWGGPKPTIGAAIIGPLDFSLNFVLTCTGPGSIASTSALVVVGGEQ